MTLFNRKFHLLILFLLSICIQHSFTLEEDVALAPDMVELQNCVQHSCEKEQQAVSSNFLLALEYSSVLDCMRYTKECQRIEKPETVEGKMSKIKIFQVKECFEICFSFKQFSKEIDKLNNCNFECASNTIKKFFPQNTSSSNFSLDPLHIKEIFFYTLLSVSTIFGIYYLYQRRKESLQKRDQPFLQRNQNTSQPGNSNIEV